MVDEAALLSALRAKTILGTGLEVFAEVPTDKAIWAALTNLSRLYRGEDLLNRVV